jgi:macrolide transport system ATP-binding/permease protein
MGRLLRRFRYWFGQRERDVALRAEIEFHRALKQQELEADGIPSDAARVAAAREIGNVTLAREDARAEWIWPWLDSVGQDTRFAARSLLRQPGFTLLSVIVLGVAIGLNTSLFTVFAGLALRPMAGLTDAERVVTVSGLQRNGGAAGMSYPEFRYLATESKTLTGLSATRNSSVSLEAGGAVRSTVMNAVSGNYFSMLGVRMALGRGFLPDEDREGAPRPVVVLGYRLWQARFGANPAVVGAAVRLNDAAYTVVGVAPPEFTGTDGAAMALWVPIASISALRRHDPGERNLLTEADDCCVYVVGRLAGGVTPKQAEAELQVLSDRFRASRARDARPIALDGTQFLRGRRAASTALAVIGVLFAGLVLVLLLACANVGNLVLARSAARTAEIGVRLSLGAGRSRIVRQLLTEGFVLALLASAVGFAVANWVPSLVLNRVAGQPAPFDIDPDFAVIAYAIGLAAIACLTFALAPALHVTRAGVMESLKQTMPKRSGMRLRSVLLGIQVAVTVVLLTSAGLLLRGVMQARAMDPGFRVDDLAIAKIELPEEAYDIPRATAFLSDLTGRLRDAGLRSFGFTSTEPFGEMSRFVGIRLAGEDKERTQNIEWMSVSPDYFQTLGIPMTDGRAFVAGDAGQSVAIVNETAARRHWNGRNPVGESFIVGGNRSAQVVGVVMDTFIDGLDDVPPLLFLPLTRAQADDFPRLLFVSDGSETAAAVTHLVGQMDRRARVEIQPLGDRLDEQLAELSLAPLAASVLGLFGLGLATVGMFGVFGYVVRQRTREIGIRIALGARSSEIIRLVLTGSSRPVAAGLAVGIAGALGASQVLRSELYGVSPLDPLTYGGVALLLAAAAMAASYLPARRAARLNPTQALRE